jgi:hypothetical protein
MIRCGLGIHGVNVLIESNCETFMEYVRRDFCFFQCREEDLKQLDIRVRFLTQVPPWEEIPRDAVPLFKTNASVVYNQRGYRYIDHGGEVLAVYDLRKDEGTVYSDDPEAMYRIAYSLLMTRLGLRLDWARRHRIHALGVSIDGAALLFLADGGCGKTTLGLEMMKHPEVGWLTDDILLVDPSGRALAFPTSPRLIQGSVVPWLPASVTLLKAPMPKEPPKVQLPCSSILSRVRPSSPLGALFLCSRRTGVGPSLRRVGFLEAFRGICDNALTGREFGHMMAYHLQFSPVYLYRMAALYLSRLRTFCYLAWTVPVYRFHMSGQISENASVVLHMCSAIRRDDPCSAANSLGNVPPAGARQ